MAFPWFSIIPVLLSRSPKSLYSYLKTSYKYPAPEKWENWTPRIHANLWHNCRFRWQLMAVLISLILSPFIWSKQNSWIILVTLSLPYSLFLAPSQFLPPFLPFPLFRVSWSILSQLPFISPSSTVAHKKHHKIFRAKSLLCTQVSPLGGGGRKERAQNISDRHQLHCFIYGWKAVKGWRCK